MNPPRSTDELWDLPDEPASAPHAPAAANSGLGVPVTRGPVGETRAFATPLPPRPDSIPAPPITPAPDGADNTGSHARSAPAPTRRFGGSVPPPARSSLEPLTDPANPARPAPLSLPPTTRTAPLRAAAPHGPNASSLVPVEPAVAPYELYRTRPVRSGVVSRPPPRDEAPAVDAPPGAQPEIAAHPAPRASLSPWLLAIASGLALLATVALLVARHA